MPKLTKRYVESITPDPNKTLFHWDSELKGFGVVVLPSGRRTYCVQYRNQQRSSKRLKLGVHGQITAEEARSLAKGHLGRIAYGDDPAQQKKEYKKSLTIKELASEYLDQYGHKKAQKSIKEDKKRLRSIILPAFGDKKVTDLTHLEIENLHNRLRKTPVQANRVLALLSRMFTLAMRWQLREGNPVKGIERYPEEKRRRWLREAEVNALCKVIDQYKNQETSNIIRLLLFTGARSDEMFKATWDQFDLEKGVWTKLAHSTKQRRFEHLPLSSKVIEILRSMEKRSQTPHLFPGRNPNKPITTIKRAWHTIRKQAGIPDVHLHDLRHTHASYLVSSGLSLSIVGRLLGHTQPSTTQRYAHLADEPLRQAVELFGNTVQEIRDKNYTTTT